MKTAIISNPLMMEHLTGRSHPESPYRIPAILKSLEASNLLTKDNYYQAGPIEKNKLLIAQNPQYIELVDKDVSSLKDNSLQFLSTGDVTISARSMEAALTAVGCSLKAADLVLKGDFSSAFAVIRPPGHHAGADYGMGFCIFNNAAITARYIQETYKLKKILIVDWDVHHGNGTQDIFYEDPNVFYFSTHQEGIYPFTGFSYERGRGQGESTTLNIPIVSTTRAKDDLIYAYKKLLMDEMDHFQPDFVIISCGFDAHIDDPIGGLNATSDTFSELTLAVKEVAKRFSKGQMISLLEGGYNLKAIAESSVKHVEALQSQ